MSDRIVVKLAIPISTRTWGALIIPSKISSAEWIQLMAVLEAMKLGLVEDDAPTPAEGESQ